MEGSKVRKPPVRTKLINTVLKGERQRERDVEASLLVEQESGNPIWSMATSQTMLWESSKCEGPTQGGLSPQFQSCHSFSCTEPSVLCHSLSPARDRNPLCDRSSSLPQRGLKGVVGSYEGLALCPAPFPVTLQSWILNPLS